jgi:hypothetical protein
VAWGGRIHGDRRAHRQQERDHRLGHAAGLVAGEVDVVGPELQERLPGVEGTRAAALGAVQGEPAGLDGDERRPGWTCQPVLPRLEVTSATLTERSPNALAMLTWLSGRSCSAAHW